MPEICPTCDKKCPKIKRPKYFESNVYHEDLTLKQISIFCEPSPQSRSLLKKSTDARVWNLHKELVHWPVQTRKLWCSSVSFPSQLRKAVVYHTCSHRSRSEAISAGIRSTPQSTHDLSSPGHAAPQIQQLGSIMWNSWPTPHTFRFEFLRKMETAANNVWFQKIFISPPRMVNWFVPHCPGNLQFSFILFFKHMAIEISQPPRNFQYKILAWVWISSGAAQCNLQSKNNCFYRGKNKSTVF